MSDDAETRTFLREALTEMQRSLASELGEGKTEQLKEYIEHHEFGLALELLIAILMKEGLSPDGYDAKIRAAAGRMGMSDSEYLADWERYSEA